MGAWRSGSTLEMMLEIKPKILSPVELTMWKLETLKKLAFVLAFLFSQTPSVFGSKKKGEKNNNKMASQSVGYAKTPISLIDEKDLMFIIGSCEICLYWVRKHFS